MKPIDLILLGGVPIDKNAASVTKQGIHYEPANFNYGHMVFDVPPPVPDDKRKKLRSEDFTGHVLGRLIVVQYWGRGSKDAGSHHQKWLCRCSCGTYTIRTAKSIKNYDGSQIGMCMHCARLEAIKARDKRKQKKYMAATVSDMQWGREKNK